MKTAISALLLLLFVELHAQPLEGLKKINGTTLYFHTMGSGEPVVIVHGGPGMSHDYFLPHLEKLSKKYKLIFYDQRASGKSAVPAVDSISMKFFIDDLEAIRKELGVEKLNLIGHSWGVLPVIQYGIAYPGKVGKVILCNPIPLSREYDAQMLENLKAKMTSQDSTDRAIIIGSKAFKAGEPEAYKKLMAFSFRHSFYDPAHIAKLNLVIPANYQVAGQALMSGLGKDLSDYNFYDAVKSFDFPVLILHGTADAVPLAAITRLQNNIPKSSLEVFNKSGHFVFIEENGKFNRRVSEFLGVSSK